MLSAWKYVIWSVAINVTMDVCVAYCIHCIIYQIKEEVNEEEKTNTQQANHINVMIIHSSKNENDWLSDCLKTYLK